MQQLYMQQQADYAQYAAAAAAAAASQQFGYAPPADAQPYAPFFASRRLRERPPLTRRRFFPLRSFTLQEHCRTEPSP